MTRINGEERNYQPSPSAIAEEARRIGMSTRLETIAQIHNARVRPRVACKYACGWLGATTADMLAHYASYHGEHVAPANDAPYTASDGRTFHNEATRLVHESGIHKLTHRCPLEGCPEMFHSDMGLRAHIAGHGKRVKTSVMHKSSRELAGAANFLAAPDTRTNENTVPQRAPSRAVRL